ncbi:hypothetical protein CPLU01_09306 [Colletotrichum plurivorum]|uniref:Uncharacterized protein n=1 Tax=Colletotrichum plurivorum TaxID=2175906 RepID=A0A8H6NB54_9PEZI|nr:hypothetical protein CPLU01_09306 [Colletotrichum plurivorum]
MGGMPGPRPPTPAPPAGGADPTNPPVKKVSRKATTTWMALREARHACILANLSFGQREREEREGHCDDMPDLLSAWACRYPTAERERNVRQSSSSTTIAVIAIRFARLVRYTTRRRASKSDHPSSLEALMANLGA